MKIKRLTGVIVPILTPYTDSGALDSPALERLCEYLVEGGVDGIFAGGTTGEFSRQRPDFREQALACIVKAVRGRIPVCAGISDGGTELCLDNLKRAEDAGADAVVTSLPYYIPVRAPEEAEDYFGAILEGSALPVILYNIPATCGAAISLDTLDGIKKHPRFLGIKDTSGDLAYLSACVDRLAGTEASVYVGDESLIAKAYRAGAAGMVPSMANCFPRLFADIHAAAMTGELERMDALCSRVDRMNRLNQYSDSWFSPNVWRKKALELMGIASSRMLKPYVPLSEDDVAQVEAFVRAYEEQYPRSMHSFDKNPRLASE